MHTQEISSSLKALSRLQRPAARGRLPRASRTLQQVDVEAHAVKLSSFLTLTLARRLAGVSTAERAHKQAQKTMLCSCSPSLLWCGCTNCPLLCAGHPASLCSRAVLGTGVACCCTPPAPTQHDSVSGTSSSAGQWLRRCGIGGRLRCSWSRSRPREARTALHGKA